MSKPTQNLEIDIPEKLIKELLTESELRMVKQRLLIIKLLEEGLSIRAIAERVKVGTDTVVRVSRMKASSEKIKEFFTEARELKNKSTWVFGKEAAEN